MKIVFGYLAWAPYAKVQFEAAVSRARGYGYDVVPFCLTPHAPEPRYLWPQLETAWSRRDADIVEARDRLLEACSDADIFWNVNGANVHPAWLADLRTFNVYGCFDDPESTAHLSEPVAKYFDAAFVGNLACLPMYQSWGIRRVAWCPIGIVHHDFPEELSTEVLVTKDRNISAAFVGERESPWRKVRLDRLVKEFPEATFRGNGWPLGRISDEDRGKLYRNTRIGWNIHNSLGPINVRLFALPANGVLQICDNRCRLGQFMKLEHEVIGFDTIEDCIDRTRYFLKHEDERREIAENGHRRYLADYSERRIWDYYVAQFRKWLGGESRSDHPIDRLRWNEIVTAPQPKVISRSVRSRLLQTINRTLKPLRLQISRTHHSTENVASTSESTVGNVLNTKGSFSRSCDMSCQRQHESDNFNKVGETCPENQAFCWAIATIVGEARKITCSGDLSAVFAAEASADPRRRISVVNSDSGVVNSTCMKDGIEFLPTAGLDLAVSINEVGPATDYSVVLSRLVHSALRVIVATTESGSATAVQDKESALMQSSWTSGEFYWVLRGFWNNVTIYHMPSPFLPELRRAEKKDQRGPLVAVCRDPRPILAGKSVKDS